MSRDDIDDRFDDRPRRESSGGSSNRTLWIILGVLALVVGVPCLGCVGIFGWGVFKVKEGVEQFGNTIVVSAAGTKFLDDTKRNPKTAYATTTDKFQSEMTEAEFVAYVKDHPILTEQNSKNLTSPLNFDIESGEPVKLEYELSVKSPIGTEQTTPRTARRIGNPPPKKDLPDDATATIILVQQNGQWKVDSFDVR